MLHCRMYANYTEFVHGWKRIYIEAANRRVKRLRELRCGEWWLGRSCRRSAGGGGGAADARLARTAGHGDAGVRRAGAGGSVVCVGVGVPDFTGADGVGAAVSIGAWQVASILRAAAKDLENGVPVRWGGREYVREAR